MLGVGWYREQGTGHRGSRGGGSLQGVKLNPGPDDAYLANDVYFDLSDW